MVVVVVVVLIYPIPEDKYHIYNYVLNLIVQLADKSIYSFKLICWIVCNKIVIL